MAAKCLTDKAIAAICIGLFLSPVGKAHIVLSDEGAAPGQAHVASLMVMHGCEEEATTSIRVRIPEGVIFVTPQYKPGWEVELIKEQLAEPYDVTTGSADDAQTYTVTELVKEVIWKNGSLPSNTYDTFSIWLRLPNTPGEIVYFKTIQECSESVTRWIEVPRSEQSSEELKEPAPFLRLSDDD